jgi:hypothetical protein
MQSPFPGMNPYLEQALTWRGFHNHFLTTLQVALTEAVDPDFFVRQEESVVIHEALGSEPVGLARLDLGIGALPGSLVPSGEERAHRSEGAEFLAPVVGQVLLAEAEVESAPYLEIRTLDRQEIVTVIELLSPTNKRLGPGRSDFLDKRRRTLQSGAHYVEIDLLRCGPRLPIRGLPDCVYYVMSSRVERRPDVELWPIQLADPLPVISIPVREPRPHVELDLQVLFDATFRAGRYGRYVHGTPPDPPLSAGDQAWADRLLGRA